jgi:serine/threonine-protein kinase
MQRCTAPHYWETFAAGPLPRDANNDRELSRLIDHPDVAALCSAGLMAQRSLDPDRTARWRIEAWPIPAGPYLILVHCLAGAPEGETPGAAFRSG